MTPAVTSRTGLHRFAEKRLSPAHSEVPNGPETKISCSNPNTFLAIKWCIKWKRNSLKENADLRLRQRDTVQFMSRAAGRGLTELY